MNKNMEVKTDRSEKTKGMTMKEEAEEEPLSPMSSVFQLPEVNTCVITMIGFKQKINNLDIILDDLKLNISKHPRFSSIPSDNGARWIKTKVNVEDHVNAPEIEINEDGEGFVDDYVSRLTMIPLDTSRPLWDIHILNVKTSDAEAVGVVRCNHALGDGMSLMSLLVACTRKTSDPDSFPTIPAIKRREYNYLPHHFRSRGQFLRSIFAMYSTVRLIWNTIVDYLQFLAAEVFLKDSETPIKESGGVENNPKRFYHRAVSFDDIKLVKNAMNMTINDVLLGVTQTALSRYLNRRYGNTHAEEGTPRSDQNNLPSRLLIRAGISVNLRQETGIQPVADMLAKGSKCRWGNYVGVVHFPLSISLETDPLVNLSKTKSIMDRNKHSLLPHLLYSTLKFFLKIFGLEAGAVSLKQTMSKITTSFSNIIGPVEEVSLHGNEIAYIALSAYGHGILSALLIHFISYADKMIISMAVDPAVIPDPHNICDEMEESLKALKDALSLK